MDHITNSKVAGMLISLRQDRPRAFSSDLEEDNNWDNSLRSCNKSYQRVIKGCPNVNERFNSHRQDPFSSDLEEDNNWDNSLR